MQGRQVMALAVGALLLSGCVTRTEVRGGSGEAVVTAVPAPAPPPAGPGGVPGAGEPAPFVVSSGGVEVEVPPFSYCWQDANSGVCADGIPRPEAVVLRAGDDLRVAYPEGDLTVLVGPLDGERRVLSAPGDQDGWIVDLSDLASGEHVVTLDWAADQGDVHAALTVRR